MRPPVHVLGRFPPPFDGQTLATELSASMLEPAFDVRRVNTQLPGEVGGRLTEVSIERLQHYLGLRSSLRTALAEAPEAPVLWHAISPARLGHWRDVAATLPAIGPGHPLYAVLHRATFERLFASPLTAATARRIVQRVQAFVFQSARLADACARHIPDAKRVLIPNTLDEPMRCTPAEVGAKQAAGPGGRPLRLLFASNMMPGKGYVDVLDAAEQLAGRGIPFSLDFVGGWPAGADRARFEARIRSAGLERQVRVHGAITDRPALRALHLAADVFLLPTTFQVETQPKAIIEALNAGTPVVATQLGVLSDMVREDESAHLVPLRAPMAIADAVERLAEPSHWLRLSRGARARFDAVFSPDVVGARWRQLAAGEAVAGDDLLAG